MNGIKTKRRGVSLLISIVLISIVMVFALGVMNLVTSSLRQTANVNRSNQAFYAAEGALEQGLLLNQTMGAGFTTNPTLVSMNCPTGGICPTATVQIQGTVDADNKYKSGYFTGKYGIPTPGTGNVGTDCQPLAPVLEGGFAYDVNGDGVIGTGETFDDPADHPCNWNRMKSGDSIAIPLYTVTDDGNSGCDYDSALGYLVCNPEKLGISEIIVRIRTACKNGAAVCAPTDRMILDQNHGDPFFQCDTVDTFTNCGDAIVYWEIAGTNIGGSKSYGLRAMDKYEPVFGFRYPTNSEIYEYKINRSRTIPMSPCTQKYCVLMQNNKGYDLLNGEGLLKDFLLNIGTFTRTGDDKISKPVLKLKIIHSLTEDITQTSIPYLEYQVLMNASTLPPADVSQTIRAEGVSGTFMQVLEVKQPQESGLLEYVINQ